MMYACVYIYIYTAIYCIYIMYCIYINIKISITPSYSHCCGSAWSVPVPVWSFLDGGAGLDNRSPATMVREESQADAGAAGRMGIPHSSLQG